MTKVATRHKLREQDSDALAAMGVEDGGESSDTTHPTQLKLGQQESLELKGGSFFIGNSM